MTTEEWYDLGVDQISIEDMLNGRTYVADEDFVEGIFQDWNDKLGWVEFGF